MKPWTFDSSASTDVKLAYQLSYICLNNSWHCWVFRLLIAHAQIQRWVVMIWYLFFLSFFILFLLFFFNSAPNIIHLDVIRTKYGKFNCVLWSIAKWIKIFLPHRKWMNETKRKKNWFGAKSIRNLITDAFSLFILEVLFAFRLLFLQ